jgi:hypothetical protein
MKRARLQILACSLLAGCGSSGLAAYNVPKDEPITDPEEAEGDPPEILLDECPTLCAIAQTELADMGCNVDCDVGLGLTYDGSAEVSVLFSLLTVEADGELQNGGSCDVVVDCSDVSPCTLLAFECLETSNNTVEHCMNEFEECDDEQHCQDIHTQCLIDGELVLQDCMDDPEYTLEECADIYENWLKICQCDYDDCMGVENPDCEEEPPPPMPLVTAPGERNVSMRFIEHHLGRLLAIEGEILVMVVPGMDGLPRGVQLRSVEQGDALHLLGLRDGDVVLEVNGSSVLDHLDDPTQLLALLDGPGVVLGIRRNGVNRQLRYRFVP